MAEKPETTLIKNIRHYLKLMGAVSTRVNAGLIFVDDEDEDGGYTRRSKRRRAFRGAEPGTSDIIGCYCGRYFAIEAKIYPNKTTNAQERFLQNVREAGGIALVAYSIDDVERLLIEEVRKELEGEFS